MSMSLAAALPDKEKALTIAALALVAVLSWVYTLSTSADTGQAMGMSMAMAWSWTHALAVLAMWWGMMVAMMLPSAMPTILLFAALRKTSRDGVAGLGSTAAFVAGYLLIWGMFGLVAAALQWLLQRADLLTGSLGLTQWAWGAGLFVVVGLYQISPLKATCLSYCRTPTQMLARIWRLGTTGAVVMGVQHGVFCLGCCAFMMLLLFFGGVMSLYWVAGLALFVAVEKLTPFGGRLSTAAGYGLILFGLALGAAFGAGLLS